MLWGCLCSPSLGFPCVGDKPLRVSAPLALPSWALRPSSPATSAGPSGLQPGLSPSCCWCLCPCCPGSPPFSFLGSGPSRAGCFPVTGHACSGTLSATMGGSVGSLLTRVAVGGTVTGLGCLWVICVLLH